MKNDDFYVGYFPIPKALKRFLVTTLFALFVIIILLSISMALSQSSPNSGTGWDATGEKVITLQGIVTQKPYDLFQFKEESSGAIKTAILTSMIKTSLGNRLKDHYNRPITLAGVMIRQDGRLLFSILNGDNAIQAANFNTDEFLITPVKNLGELSLKGEIVDPKCYLGAMKPGGGKVHKSCAVLCLRGGIPPMFVTRNSLLQETYYLITDEQGAPLVEPIIPYVGDPISVRGIVEQRGDLLMLRLNTKSIQRF